MGEEEAAKPDNVYLPLTVKELVANMMSKLKDLSARDRTESAKIIKFEKRVASEDDEDILAEVKGLLQKVSDINNVTKADISVFKGKIR